MSLSRQEGHTDSSPFESVFFSCVPLISGLTFLFVFILFLFSKTEVCGGPSCPEAHFIDQAGLKSTETLPPLPPKC